MRGLMMHGLIRVLVLLLPLLVAFAGTLRGQGVTTAALFGTVTSADSTALEDAVVAVTNTATGERWQTTTRSRGRYAFEIGRAHV